MPGTVNGTVPGRNPDTRIIELIKTPYIMSPIGLLLAEQQADGIRFWLAFGYFVRSIKFKYNH